MNYDSDGRPEFGRIFVYLGIGLAVIVTLCAVVSCGVFVASRFLPLPTRVPAPTSTAAPIPTTTPANSIQNISWQWLSVTQKATNQTAVVSNPERYTIIFYADGTLAGKADCNTFTGTYSQQSGFFIKIGTFTTAFCGEGSLDQEYMKLLANVAAGGPDGSGGLALETAGGAQRMQFRNGGLGLNLIDGRYSF